MTPESTTGAIVLAAAGTGLAVGGAVGPLNFPLEDFGWATGFAIIGILGRAVLDAKAARDLAKSNGSSNLPGLDYVSLVYACFGAPLIGGLALAGVRGVGFVPDGAAAPVIMGVGYMGRDGVNFIVGLARDAVSRRTGGQGGTGHP
jgi:hypothetical protein